MPTPLSSPSCQAVGQSASDSWAPASNGTDEVQVARADGLLGQLGMFNVSIKGQTHLMTQPELDELAASGPRSSADGESADQSARHEAPAPAASGTHDSAPASPAANRVESFASEVIAGDFHKGESTWGGVLGNVIVGVIPGVGQIADARDTAAAVKNLWDEPSLANAGMLGLAVVGWVPLIGDTVKGSAKVGKKLVKEGAETAVKTEKAAARVGKAADANEKSIDAASEGSKLEKAVVQAPRPVKGSSRPGPGEALVGSSRSQMRAAAQERIASDPDHPLRFLLDENGKFKSQVGQTSHRNLADRPDLVQMGHIGSNKIGGEERLMLQGAWENQFNNVTVESPHKGGAVLDQPAISIGGIAVDLKTAQSWEAFGFIKPGTTAAAPRIAP